MVNTTLDKKLKIYPFLVRHVLGNFKLDMDSGKPGAPLPGPFCGEKRPSRVHLLFCGNVLKGSLGFVLEGRQLYWPIISPSIRSLKILLGAHNLYFLAGDIT